MTKHKLVVLRDPGVELRPIPGFNGLYSASKDGRVWSHTKTMGVSRHGGRWLKPGLNKGYLTVALFKDGVQFMFQVHRAVALAWVPNPEGLPEVNHDNGIPADCRSDNLEWTTHAGNCEHAHRTGLNRSSRILSDEQLAEVKAAIAAETLGKDIAVRFGISAAMVSSIKTGAFKTRRHPLPTGENHEI